MSAAAKTSLVATVIHSGLGGELACEVQHPSFDGGVLRFVPRTVTLNGNREQKLLDVIVLRKDGDQISLTGDEVDVVERWKDETEASLHGWEAKDVPADEDKDAAPDHSDEAEAGWEEIDADAEPEPAAEPEPSKGNAALERLLATIPDVEAKPRKKVRGDDADGWERADEKSLERLLGVKAADAVLTSKDGWAPVLMHYHGTDHALTAKTIRALHRCGYRPSPGLWVVPSRHLPARELIHLRESGIDMGFYVCNPCDREALIAPVPAHCEALLAAAPRAVEEGIAAGLSLLAKKLKSMKKFDHKEWLGMLFRCNDDARKGMTRANLLRRSASWVAEGFGVATDEFLAKADEAARDLTKRSEEMAKSHARRKAEPKKTIAELLGSGYTA